MKYFLFFLVPFLLSLIFTPIMRIVSIKCNIVDKPRPDRWHKQPTAVLGGVSIYLASVISALFLGVLNKTTLGLFAGGTILFIFGLADDKFNFRPYTKLFVQIVAGCVVVFLGTVVNLPVSIILAIPLTLFWIVGVTNSFNILDNIDGLAAGIAAIAGLMLFISSLLFSSNPLGMLALILCGASLGFLPYNFNPAKIFMGDSGSMFLGYSLAVISIAGTARHISNFFITLLIPVLILSVPIFDTIFVMVVRKIHGKNIFRGGKDHTSHHLVALGISQRKTVLLLYAISIAFGLIAISYSQFNIFIISIIAFLAVVILVFFGLFLFEETRNAERPDIHFENQKNNITVFNKVMLHKRRIVEVLLDIVLICIAYYSACFLRFGGLMLSNSSLHLIKQSLLWIILIKLSIFFMFRLYSEVWRYIGISDLIKIFKVTSISSVASILFFIFVFRLQGYSRAVFFMDWLLLLFLISGTRILFRLLGEFFNNISVKNKNILIIGTTDTGEMAMREIKKDNVINYNPAGFVDNRPTKIGAKIQGVPVLGSYNELKNIIENREIKEVVILKQSVDRENLSEIISLCEDNGITYREADGIFDEDKVSALNL